MDSLVGFLVIVLAAFSAVLLAAVVLSARALDRQSDRRTNSVLDAIRGLKPALAGALAASARSAVEGSAPSSQRSALVPLAPSTSTPRTNPPPPSSEARARDAAARAAPVEVAEDEGRTVEVPSVEVAPEDPEEARVRQLLLTLPFPAHSPMTLAQYIREKADGILNEEKHPNVKHCESAACFPGAWGVCACACAPCKAHRHALTLAVHLFGLPIVRLPGEKPEAWDLRRRAHEEQPKAVVLPPSSHVVACMAAVSLPRADALFWAKLDAAGRDGVDVKHCRGPECDPLRPTCECPCTPCDRRRTLAERAENEARADAPAEPPREPPPHERVIDRWHALQDASEANGYPASHCDGGTCGGEASTHCECNCDGCARAVVLLMRAEREVLGSDG